MPKPPRTGDDPTRPTTARPRRPAPRLRTSALPLVLVMDEQPALTAQELDAVERLLGDALSTVLRSFSKPKGSGSAN